jgi:hypothetical protein
MGFLSNLFGRKKAKKSDPSAGVAIPQQEGLGLLNGLAKAMVNDIYAESREIASKALDGVVEADDDSTHPVPGDVTVILTDAKTVGLGLGNLFHEDKQITYLDVMTLMNPGTRKIGLFAKGPDGYQNDLEGLIKDQHQSYVLRIASDNLDYLKLNPQIWSRVKKVIGG